MGIRPALESERRLSGLSRRLSQRHVRPDGQEPDREPSGGRYIGRRQGPGNGRVSGLQARTGAAKGPETAATPAPAAVAARAPEKVASAEPAAPSEKNWKEEIGSADTEKALDLTSADQKEIQQRLIALGLYKGAATGSFDPGTRSAIAEWQKKDGAAATSFLGSMQLAALRAESDTVYQRYLAAQSAPRQAPKQAVKPEPKRALRAAPAPKRRVTKRSSPSAPAEAAQTTPDPGGTPEWRRRAGLPVSDPPTTSGPAFWQGAATGAAAGFHAGTVPPLLSRARAAGLGDDDMPDQSLTIIVGAIATVVGGDFRGAHKLSLGKGQSKSRSEKNFRRGGQNRC